ncbi:hypothetical protein V5799_018589 [Amblyomma americanum]|uniref:Uncharacterized protein n=1 Tax=Amblyomma americanum TaxID=6943 RepID=A0AAQ4EYU6_AMBAM
MPAKIRQLPSPQRLERLHFSVAGQGHQCTATSVDDYEGVSWLERLECPEWPVPKHCFENRDEDLSVSSCVESIWSPRSRAPSTSARPARSLGGRDQWPLRAEDGAQDAVMAKLGLQVTCLGSGSPMSKSYPGRKAVFSAHRGLSLYKSGGDAAAATGTAAAALRSRTKDDFCGASTPEPKPGAGDHRNLPNVEALDSKHRSRSVKQEEEQGEQNISYQQDRGLYANSAECANFVVFHAETAITSEVTICKHLEGLLEECQTNCWKESVTLGQECSDGDGYCGSGSASGVLHVSASSGDIKLDHIEDIDRRLHSTVRRRNGGGCGVEEDRRLQLGLGDFDPLGGTVPCNRHRRDASSHSEVTGSGDCKEGSGGSHLPSTSSPIPAEARGDGAQLGSVNDADFTREGAKVTNVNPYREHITEMKTLQDDSFSSDVTLTDISIGDGIDEADFEVASQLSSELGEEFVDADYVIEPDEGLLEAALINPRSVVDPYRLRAARREPPGSEWGSFEAFMAQQGDGASDKRPFRIGMVRKSASVSGEGFDSVGTKFPSREVTTVSAGSSPASRPPQFAFTVCDKEQRQTCLSPACSLDGQVSASSCDSFFTVASYDDDLSLPKANQAGAAKSRESPLGDDFLAAVSPSTVSSPLRLESQSFHIYENRAGSGCGNERDTGVASVSGEPDELAHGATLQWDGGSSSTTTLSFHVLDEQAGEISDTSASSQSESSEEGSPRQNSPEGLQSESPRLSPLALSPLKSQTPSYASNHATCSSSVASSPFSLPDSHSYRDSLHYLTDANPKPFYSLRESFTSEASSTHENISTEYAHRTSSTPSDRLNHAACSRSVESPPFSLPDYRSCRDFLRNLTDANPELSLSLSESVASDERNIDLDTSVEDACRQIFSSYNESFTQFESVQSFAALPRFSTTEMLTCPELRPLRLSGCREDVFKPVLSRDPSRRLKRQAVPTASDTDAFASKVSEKRTHMSSVSSVSMPDLKR